MTRLLRIYWLETKTEFLKRLRLPMYVFGTVAFPLMFYVLFGVALGKGDVGGTPVARYILATYGAFGVIGATLLGFGGGLAMDRGMGWLEVKRASPMPAPAYFVAKTASCLLFSAIIMGLLLGLGAAIGGVRMPAGQWFGLAGALVAGAIPFCALGAAIGYFVGPNAAPAVINLIYLPMAFCSGLWVPLDFLPRALQDGAQALPAYHLAQIGLAVLGAPVKGTVGAHVFALVGFTVFFLGLAALGHRREEARIYG